MGITAVVAGGILGSAVYSDQQQQKAAKRSEAAFLKGLSQEERQFQQTREDLSPYREAGKNALEQYNKTIGGDYSGFTSTPDYQFGLEQGEKALGRAQAARGNYFSPRAMNELSRYGQGYGSQRLTSYLSRLQGLSSMGQTASAQTGQFGAQSVAAQNQLRNSAAGVRGEADIGRANLVSGVVEQGIGLYGASKGFGGGSGSQTGLTSQSSSFDQSYKGPTGSMWGTPTPSY
jgi:hypothetical protein